MSLYRNEFLLSNRFPLKRSSYHTGTYTRIVLSNNIYVLKKKIVRLFENFQLHFQRLFRNPLVNILIEVGTSLFLVYVLNE